jgi:hypothetical protein
MLSPSPIANKQPRGVGERMTIGLLSNELRFSGEQKFSSRLWTGGFLGIELGGVLFHLDHSAGTESDSV